MWLGQGRLRHVAELADHRAGGHRVPALPRAGLPPLAAAAQGSRRFSGIIPGKTQSQISAYDPFLLEFPQFRQNYRRKTEVSENSAEFAKSGYVI